MPVGFPSTTQRNPDTLLAERRYHHLSQSEIGGGKRISRHLSNFLPEIDQG